MQRCDLESGFRRAGDVGVLTLHGDLDITTVEALDRALAGAAARVPPLSVLVVDLEDVQFCGARGFDALLHCAEALRRSGGRLVLARRPFAVRRLMDLLAVEHHPHPLRLPGWCAADDAVEPAVRVTGTEPALR